VRYSHSARHNHARLVGPLINGAAHYVEPAIARMPAQTDRA